MRKRYQNISDETYQQALVAAEALKKELEPQLLGKIYPALSCGGVCLRESKVVDIEYPGLKEETRNQIGIYLLWNLLLAPTDNSLPKGTYSHIIAGLRDLPRTVIDELFQRHFRDIPITVWLESDYKP